MRILSPAELIFQNSEPLGQHDVFVAEFRNHVGDFEYEPGDQCACRHEEEQARIEVKGAREAVKLSRRKGEQRQDEADQEPAHRIFAADVLAAEGGQSSSDGREADYKKQRMEVHGVILSPFYGAFRRS